MPRGGRLAARDQRRVIAALGPHTNKVVFHFGTVSRSQCPSCLATRGSGLADYADFLASSQPVCLDKPGDGRDRRQRVLCVGGLHSSSLCSFVVKSLRGWIYTKGLDAQFVAYVRYFLLTSHFKSDLHLHLRLRENLLAPGKVQ